MFKKLFGRKRENIKSRLGTMVGKVVEITMEDGTVFKGVLERPNEVVPSGTKVKIWVENDVVEGELVEPSRVPDYFFAMRSEGRKLVLINSNCVVEVKEL
ncbi:hypothetical protein DRP05_02755 [Archaeoglobales archaeon]|nr:MAG: hypothetical protein DRP05_02755 [Archaeoglobales archaeon]